MAKDLAIKRPKAMDNRLKNRGDEAIHDAQNFENVRNINSLFYTGIDPRRRQEMADSHMVGEDDKAMANLSPQFIHKEYPRISWYSNPFMDAFEI
jgi:hypothetical protein